MYFEIRYGRVVGSKMGFWEVGLRDQKRNIYCWTSITATTNTVILVSAVISCLQFSIFLKVTFLSFLSAIFHYRSTIVSYLVTILKWIDIDWRGKTANSILKRNLRETVGEE